MFNAAVNTIAWAKEGAEWTWCKMTEHLFFRPDKDTFSSIRTDLIESPLWGKDGDVSIKPRARASGHNARDLLFNISSL